VFDGRSMLLSGMHMQDLLKLCKEAL